MAGQPISPGDVLDGKYEIVRELGSGAMGVVFEAMHLTLAKKVAVKTLLAEIAANAQLLGRFEQEARAASAIGHPNIIEVYDLGTAPNGARYMVMEHLTGESLGGLLEHVPLLTPERAGNLMAQVLSALNAAHKAGIVHRDLKPDNIFITSNDDNPEYVKLLDFGISKVLEAADPRISGVKGGAGSATRFGDLLGTPLYMSPEQARGETNLDHRIDLWACGTVLYEMLCGQCPFDGDNYQQILARILQGKFIAPRQIRPAIPPALEAVILKAMSFERVQRYPGASEMRAQLIQALLERNAQPAPVAVEALPLDLDLAPPPKPSAVATMALPGAGAPAPKASSPSVASGGSGSIRSALDVGATDAAADAQLVDALSRLNSGDVLLSDGARVAEPAPRPPPAAAAPVTTVTFDEPSQSKPVDLFAPPGAEEEVALTVNRADVSIEHARTVAPDEKKTVTDSRNLSRGGGSARSSSSKGLSVGTVIGVVFFLILAGAGGFAGYRYYTKGYILDKPKKKTMTVRFAVIPSDAEILVNDVPLTTRPFVAELAVPYRFTFKSPGRLSAQRTLIAQPGAPPTISVRLSHLVAPLSRAIAHAAASSEPKSGAATAADYKDVDAALGKLRLYISCLEDIVEPLVHSRDTYNRSTRKGRIKKSRLPSAIPIPPAVVNRCRSQLASAGDRAPQMDALRSRANAFVTELNRLIPVLKRLATYYDKKQYEADDLKLGRRKHAELLRGYSRTLEEQRKFYGLAMSLRLDWQSRELATIAAREGLGAHWHMRRLVVASQSWVGALLRRSSSKQVAARAAALATLYKAAVDLGTKSPEVMKSISGGAAFLKAMGEVVAASRATVSKQARARALDLHNRTVEMFNKMTL